MKLLRRKDRPTLESRLDALLEAASLGEGRLAGDAVRAAREVAERAGARRRLSVAHTVVALAGATGSGKSSLYNALAGEELAGVGVTRPTTATAQAALWDGEEAGPLLDWLDVPHRHSASGDGLTGLVLLDLPDHDSIRLTHRLEVDRLVELVDLLVWVLDPQKYADAAVHERYLRPLAGHRDVMVVVLNQIDRLPPDAVDRCLRDLRRLLDDDGLTGVPVLGVSARTGAGVPELRALLAGRVAERKAWSDRLAADVRDAAALLRAASATAPRDTGPPGDDIPERPGTIADGDDIPGRPGGKGALGRSALAQGRAALSEGRDGASEGPATGAVARQGEGLEGALTAALSKAAGVPLVVEAVAKGHRHRAVVATGWPVTRWVRRFRPDPLRRLRIGAAAPARRELGGRAGRAGKGDGRAVEPVSRTSVPAASMVQRAQVETAIRDVGEQAARGLPAAWDAAVRRAARSRAAELPDAVDRAVGRTSLGVTRRPRWWRAVNVVQWLVFATMVAGAGWLAGLFGMDYLRLPEPPTPTVWEVPWPTALLAGRALAGVLVALLSRLAAWLGGRRRARKAARALREAIGEVGSGYVLGPVREELARHARFAEAVETARG
ncbi:YfjP family GTPase [Nonomuraea sp. SBT364]|uniref:YfjP family GTPase n=1 Tax=Nonomuraea sp. SBT364 TaxID=1580530 RepID=UPI00066E27A8|nr:YfjP family GTPase [Nonomuraea sp. SBT364]